MWHPKAWREFEALQQVTYGDTSEYEGVLEQLDALPPLISSGEVEALGRELADAMDGNGFLLQGGDCCERFTDCNSQIIVNKLKVLLQMSLVLVYGGSQRVIRVGRIAGQYAKPRSSDSETRGGETLPSFRGWNINRPEFLPEARKPDPQLLLVGHQHSAMTLNFIRGLMDGGFADLHHPEFWDLDFLKHAKLGEAYRQMIEGIGGSIDFMERLTGQKVGALERVKFYCSHEALHLGYEQAMTKQVPHRRGWFNLGTHLPWIGDRTRGIDHGHVHYCAGIENPVGVKVGNSMEPSELVALVEKLNPSNAKGKIVLICRFGVSQIQGRLGGLIDAIIRARLHVLWVCDPMHGNTRTASTGYKTRSFDDILGELKIAFQIHQQKKTRLGGVHFELTGDNVTECTGGARGLDDEGLKAAYESEVDPRLNAEQSLEMAFELAKLMA